MPKQANSATKSIAYNTGVQVLGKMFVLVLAAVSIGILTRYLGADGYGKFSLALVYLSLFGIVGDLGLFTIAVREMAKDESKMQAIVANTLSLRALMALGVFSVAVGVGWLLPYTPDIKIAIAIAAFSHFFGLLNSTLVTVFLTKLRMGFAVISDIVGRAASLGAVIWVATADLGFYAVVATAALGSFVTFVVSTLLARRFVKIRLYRNVRLWKEMLVEALPLGAALVVSQLYYRVDILLLSFLRTTAEVGVYSAVFKVLELLLTLPLFFLNSVFPVMIQRFAADPKRAKPLIQKSFDLLLIAGMAFAGGGLILAPDIMRLIGGAEFVSGGDALRVILFAMVLTFMLMAFANLFVAQGKQMQLLKFGSVGLVLNIGLNLIFIPKFGIVGSAVATLVSEVVIFGLYIRYSSRHLKLPISLRSAPRVLLATLVMVGTMWPLRDSFPLAFLAGGTVYVGMIFALRLIGRDVIRELLPNRS